MSHTCPNCGMGTLKPTRSTYVRWWRNHLVTVPDFATWRCDACGYTRYDTEALTKINSLLGPDEEAWSYGPHTKRRTKGPAEQGPRRWSS